MNFELNNRIKMLNSYSNIDVLYGPYNSIEDALDGVPVALRAPGMTVGIVNAAGKVEEYWWNTEDTTDEGLTKKIESVELVISRIGERIITAQEGDIIVLSFNVAGRATISKARLYQYVNGQELFVTEYTNVTKGANNIVISNPSQAGVYQYRIKVTDTGGYNAKTDDGELDYVDYEVRYGGISITVDTSNLDRIKIKNIQSLASQYFTATISVRDDSFEVQKVQLYGLTILDDGTNDVYLDMTPYKTLSEPNDTYLGFNYYILPNYENFTDFDGKRCYVKILYTEDGVARQEQKLLFTLLKTDSLELVPQSVPKDYYIGFLDYYKFQLLSGVENVSVYVSQAENSDFDFDPVTVSTYNTYSLRILPNNVTQSAYLNMRCVYIINNVLFVRNFSVLIGTILEVPERAYYIPESLTVVLDLVIHNDRGQFDIVDDFTSEDHFTCAFLVDMYCRIQQINNKSTKYVRIFQGNSEIGYISEDIINCRGIITDTPLNEWVQISIGYNLEDNVIRNNQTYTGHYFAIYINGMIVKNTQVTESTRLQYDIDAPIRIEISNGINVQDCFVYYNNGETPVYINPNTSRQSIVYNNYLYYNATFNEPADLPVLKLWRILDETDRRTAFDLIKVANTDLEYLTLFGTIGLPKALNNMAEYDPQYLKDQLMDHDNATLFRQSVNIKKPAQKAYATLCYGEYYVNGVNVLEDCIIEVHTQGTSTLVYPVPNFKFTFWKNEGGLLVRYKPPFISKGDGTYYQESIYTAKADSMDSSHLNNTPTCNFYNNLIQHLIDDTDFPTFTGSPSARNGGIDAIMGFPIVMEISDIADGSAGSFLNIGSFMLNIDKTGDSLGFEVSEGGQTLKCISFEGTSNDNLSGASGRFDNNENLPYYENESDIDWEASIIQAAITASGKKLPLDEEIDGQLVRDYNYVKWCKFLSGGLEYRYPDSDIYKTSTSNNREVLTKIMKASDFKKLYRMWAWVAQSDSYTDQKYKEEFTDYFDLDYCILYFIQLMIFAQTDNLGKNAMFDCWDGEHWYPRPYDLDSEAGLDNNGNDNIAPFVEIKPEFSLNYDPTYTREQMEAEYLIQDPDGTVSQIPFSGQMLDRYHFSSNNSKLWINFYTHYKSDIESFYNKLRTDNDDIYNSDVVSDLCKNSVVDVLGIHQYNQDFLNKYLATDYQYLALGNRWYKYKKWMTQRFAFCDSYFNSTDTVLYGLKSQMPEYTMEVECPQYVKQSYQEADPKPYFVVESRTMPGAGSGGATKLTLNMNQGQLLNSGHFKRVLHEQGPANFTGLVKLDVSGNDQVTNITSLVGSNLPRLSELNASNSAVSTLKNIIPESLKKLTALNINIDSIDFPSNCLVEEINLTGSTIRENISFANLPNLKRLIITGCTFNANLTLDRLPQLEEFIFTGATFNGNIIISNNVAINQFSFANTNLNGIVFTGNSINIKKLNFIKTRFTQNTINLNEITDNIEEIYFNDCTGLLHLEITENKKFSKLSVFSLYGSSIVSIGATSGVFDASVFNSLSDDRNISSLRRVASYNANTYIPTSYTGFSFYNTKVTNITNLQWNGSGENLFRGCYNLVSVAGSLTLTTKLDYMLYRCENIETLPSTINVDSSTVSAIRAFCCTHKLSYSTLSSIISKCTNVTDFSYACYAKLFNNGAATTINLNALFANNNVVLNLTAMFGCGGFGGSDLPGQVNNFVVTGKLPSTVTDTTRMFLGYSSNTTLRIPYDIFENAASIENTSGMFYNTVITFVGDSLPEDYQGNVLTNAIDYRFFYQGLTNTLSVMCGMFLSSNVQIYDKNVFLNLTALTDCSACFQGSRLSEFYTSIIIDDLWIHNPNLTTVAGCFRGIKNITCVNTLNFHPSVTSINISGLFSLPNYASDSTTININIDNIYKINENTRRTVITNDYWSYIGNTTHLGGVFQNRNVHILDSTSSILSCLTSACRQIFRGAHLYLNTDVTTIDLSSVSECNYMFAGCICYKYNQSGVYDDTNRYFLDMLLPILCAFYEYMFSESQILRSLPSIRSSSASDCKYMFYNCVILSNTIELSPTYLQICKNSISNTSHMFLANRYITELGYNPDCGLFEGCVNLTDVTSMFEGCSYLHKGVPNNLFGVTELTGITSLDRMFARTCVWYDVEDELTSGRKAWMDGNTLAPLTKLRSVHEMFYGNRIGNTSTGYGTYRDQVYNSNNVLTYIVSPDTFALAKILDIRGLFKQTGVVRNIPMRFLGFSRGEEAFYYSPITAIDQDFISDQYVSEVVDASRMFYVHSGSTSPKTVLNLGIFVDELINGSNANISNIAGNLANTDVPEYLKATLADEEGIVNVSPVDRPWYII